MAGLAVRETVTLAGRADRVRVAQCSIWENVTAPRIEGLTDLGLVCTTPL